MALVLAGKAGNKMLDRKRSVESDADHPNLLAAADQVINRFVDRVHARAHQDDDSLGLGMAMVVEQVVMPAGPIGEPVHGFLSDAGQFVIIEVAGFPAQRRCRDF